MYNLVFIEPDYLKAEPFTTSKVISDYTGIRHDKIKTAILKNNAALETFGLSTSYEGESSGGRPEIIYKLNEQQTTLLITLLKNTERVVKFKTELVRQFYDMRSELLNRKFSRQALVPVHKNLSEAVKLIPEHTSKAHDYSKYNNLAYMILFGMSAKKIKLQRGADKKATGADFLTALEMEHIAQIKDKICTCIELQMSYQEIKAKLLCSLKKAA